MRGAFAGGKTTIVTADTAIHHADVTEGDAGPVHSRVAHVTGLCRWNMGSGFACGNDTVVARLTRSQHLGMINDGGG